MIQKLQKVFHTDKWWGRSLLIAFLYIIYWIVFYIIIPFIILVIQNFNFGGIILFLFLLILAPMLSFYIPKTLLKIFNGNKYLIYGIHIILIILPIFLYLLLILMAIKNGFSGMFV